MGGNFGAKTKAKLTVADVIDVKAALRDGIKPKALAEKYRLDLSSIYNIATGRCWPEVKVAGYHPDTRPTTYRRLTESQVAEMRRKYRMGDVIYKDFAKRYNASISTIRRAIKRICYQWV